jgi:very-short-patch-repair endonuclease
VVTRGQLLARGVTSKAIDHRIATGRLHRVRRGVYAVGRPRLTRHGRWMAAVLSCGPEAVLSHASAAALWELRDEREHEIEISVTAPRCPRQPGIRVHRRVALGPPDIATYRNIPVTSPTRTLIDLALRLRPGRLEAAINEADKRDLVEPESLRSALGGLAGQPGVTRLGTVLDRRTFTLTDSELERLFLPIARRAGFPPPATGARINGFKVDFYWPELGLVVETDGLRYHRTPAQQARDRRRDQAHAAAGLTPLRFTHAQVRYEPGYVQATLARVAKRIAGRVGEGA